MNGSKNMKQTLLVVMVMIASAILPMMPEAAELMNKNDDEGNVQQNQRAQSPTMHRRNSGTQHQQIQYQCHAC